MIRALLISVFLIMVLLGGSAVAGMQHRMGGQMPMGSQAETQESSSGQHQMMGRGMMCPMMAMMMESAGTASVGSQQMDPKAVGRLLQLRGDLLKAMGEVLLKHGKAMEEGQ